MFSKLPVRCRVTVIVYKNKSRRLQPRFLHHLTWKKVYFFLDRLIFRRKNKERTVYFRDNPFFGTALDSRTTHFSCEVSFNFWTNNMGRPADSNGIGGGGRAAGPPPSSCCGCRSCSWLLYLLVMLSLSLSVMVFWMSLYKQQEINKELLKLQREQNETIAEQVSAQIAPVRWELSKMALTSEKRQGRKYARNKELPDWVFKYI